MDINEKIIEKVIDKVVDNALDKPTVTLGEVLDGIMLLVFTPFIKHGIKKRAEIESYRESVARQVSNIPPENLTEPPLSIVGPALEASKYYIENEEMKEMFAKLIASSMNTATQSLTHVSFVEIIKQLSPLDASNLKLITEKQELPLAEYHLLTKDNNMLSVEYTNVFLSNPICQDIDLQAASITNLIRLGLIYTKYESPIVGVDYSNFLATSCYQQLKHTLRSKYDSNIKYYEPFINEGVVLITPLGQNFSAVCL